MKKHLIFMLLFFCSILSAENQPSLSGFHFYQDVVREIKIDLETSGIKGFEMLVKILKEIEADPHLQLVTLEVKASLPPEKGKTQSEQLCLDRVKDIMQYVNANVRVPEGLKITNSGIAWAELRKMVLDSKMQYRNEIISIIDKIPEETRIKNKLVDSRNKRLMDLGNGSPYIYMRENFFPKLITSSVTISYCRKDETIDSSFLQYLDRFTQKTNLLDIATLVEGVDFAYHINVDTRDPRGLERSVEILKELIANPHFELTDLKIGACQSPDRGKTQSEQLCLDKVKEIVQYIINRITIPASLVTTNIHGIAWAELRDLVSSSEMECREEIVNIINGVPEETRIKNKLIDSRNKQLMDLEKGNPYFYMRRHFFPKLINSNLVISYSIK